MKWNYIRKLPKEMKFSNKMTRTQYLDTSNPKIKMLPIKKSKRKKTAIKLARPKAVHKRI